MGSYVYSSSTSLIGFDKRVRIRLSVPFNAFAGKVLPQAEDVDPQSCKRLAHVLHVYEPAQALTREASKEESRDRI